MKKEVLIPLLIIFTLACFLRLWKLNEIPPGLYPDEAINGNEAIFKPGQVFYKENNGREGLFVNLISLSFLIFGPSIFSLRLVSAIAGTLTVLGLYFLTKELFSKWNQKRGRYIGLLSSFLAAVSFWHINFSRIAFRGILVPFVLVFSLHFLLKGWRRKRKLDFVIAGLIFGLGFYTYIAFRFAVLLLAIILILKWSTYKKEGLGKTFILNTLLYFILTAIIVALPLGFYFLQNPQYFLTRAAGVSVFATKTPFKELGRSLILHLGMFNVSGDPNWRHNLSGSPILFWPVGILFLIGLFFSVKELINSVKERSYGVQVVSYGLLMSWWLIMLLPGILTSEGIPHSLRCIGALPPTFILAALGGELGFEWFKKRVSFKMEGFNRYLMILCVTFLILSFIFAQYLRYFELWAKNPNTKNAFSKDLVEIGNYLNSLPEETQKYVIVNLSGVPVPYPEGIPMPSQTPKFIETVKFGHSRTTYLKPENLDQIEKQKEAIIVLLKYDKKILNQLILSFPDGRVQKEGKIWTFKL